MQIKEACEWLLTHGFEKLNGDDIPHGWPQYHNGDIYFSESGLKRQHFVVIFGLNCSPDDEEKIYYHRVSVQIDIGCGFVEIPEAWSEFDPEWFEPLFVGIRGEKPCK